jgi:hypothetical protein
VETTFGKDLGDPEVLKQQMRGLYRSLYERWKKSGLEDDQISGVVLKLRYHDFQIQTHEAVHKGGFPALPVFGSLMESAWKRRPLRLMGFGFKLKSPDQVRAERDQLKLFE